MFYLNLKDNQHLFWLKIRDFFLAEESLLNANDKRITHWISHINGYLFIIYIWTIVFFVLL